MSNATDRTVFVEMEAIETVRKGNTQALDLGIGVNAGTTNFAGTTVEVRLDQGVEGAWSKVFSFSRPSRCCLRKSCWTRERRRCTLTPPGTSLFQVVATIQGLGIDIATDSSFSLTRQQRAVLLHNSLFARWRNPSLNRELQTQPLFKESRGGRYYRKIYR